MKLSSDLSVMEVYRLILERGAYYRDQAKKYRERGEAGNDFDDHHLDLADDQENFAQCFFECAALLERTKEINH